jgi:hypothetical protein
MQEQLSDNAELSLVGFVSKGTALFHIFAETPLQITAL